MYLYAPRPRRWAAERAIHNYARRGLSMSPREHSSRNSCHYLDDLYLIYSSSIRCFSTINYFHFVLSNTGSWMVDMSPEHLPFVHVAGLWTQPPASNPHATCDKCGFGCHTKKDCTHGLYHILYSWWLQRALVLNRKRRSGSCSSRTAFRQALSIPTRARRLQIEKDAYLLNFAEILTWYEVVLNLFTLKAYCLGHIPTPAYPDRLNKKFPTWKRLTRRCRMPATARRVVLSEIKNGAKIGFEVEPPNVLLDNKRWTDPVAWNSCAVATINAIKFGIINTCPTSVKRRNKYFVVDSALLHEFKRVVLLLFQCMQYCPKKPDPDHPTIKQFREIFHASSTGSDRTDLRAFKNLFICEDGAHQ
jgi:hypothetical protein